MLTNSFCWTHQTSSCEGTAGAALDHRRGNAAKPRGCPTPTDSLSYEKSINLDLCTLQPSKYLADPSCEVPTNDRSAWRIVDDRFRTASKGAPGCRSSHPARSYRYAGPSISSFRQLFGTKLMCRLDCPNWATVRAHAPPSLDASIFESSRHPNALRLQADALAAPTLPPPRSPFSSAQRKHYKRFYSSDVFGCTDFIHSCCFLCIRAYPPRI